MIPSEFNHDMMAQRRKLRLLHEAQTKSRFEVGDRVKLMGKSGQTQKKHGFSTTGKIKEATISSGRQFFRVTWDDGKNSSRFDLQSQLGLDVVKEETIDEALKGPTKDSWLTTAKVGGLFNVFRVFGDSRDADIERLPRVHTSARAANKAARAVGEKTGEELRESLMQAEFPTQQDAGVFMFAETLMRADFATRQDAGAFLSVVTDPGKKLARFVTRSVPVTIGTRTEIEFIANKRVADKIAAIARKHNGQLNFIA